MTTRAFELRATSYRAIWRWHFYAGILCAPILIVLAITGALYLFDREIERLLHPSLRMVTVGASSLPIAAQEAAVRAAWPTAELRAARLNGLPQESSVWTLRLPDDAVREVFVNPYTGAILGSLNADWQLMPVARRLHGTLLAGEAGSYVVELVACWTLVMLVTGIYLWWPRRWKATGVVVPRLSAKGRRFWRDLHAIPSLFNAALVLFLVLTGLPWSAFWGAQFAKLGEVVPFVEASPNFKAHRPHPPSHSQAKALSSPLPWPVQHSPKPHVHTKDTTRLDLVEPYLANIDPSRSGVRVIYPANVHDVVTLNYIPDQAQGQRTLYLDPATGAVIDDIGWEDYSAVAKAVEWGVMVHMGRQFGLLNQILGLVVCFGLIGSVIAGLSLWWRRRPKGALAAPRLRETDQLPASLVGLLIALAVLFPLVGLSIATIAAGDWARQSLVRLNRPGLA
jgi:uncharacterized iron-regulated membrane protein